MLPVEPLLAWYDTHARDLPWRNSEASPWAVLVSEVMLQQTPVARVLPVYTEWISRWPTPGALADAPLGEALRVWGRLGYPRRAKRLHECAVVIDEQYDGQVPNDLETLLNLPGIGAYTARAVAAFAFGQRQAPVDVNVRRVLARVVGGVGDAGPATTSADFAAMEKHMPAEAPKSARFCVAVMELGATVCLKRTPQCDKCPISSKCQWRSLGYPAYAGPQRTQTYEGTDRQARGRLLALLRDSPAPVPLESFETVWTLSSQRERALTSLVADGLVVRNQENLYMLPA